MRPCIGIHADSWTRFRNKTSLLGLQTLGARGDFLAYDMVDHETFWIWIERGFLRNIFRQRDSSM